MVVSNYSLRKRASEAKIWVHRYQAEIIGCRVHVKWDDGMWYGGRVMEFDPVSGGHTVVYDDDDQRSEPLNSDELTWEFEEEHLQPGAAARSSRNKELNILCKHEFEHRGGRWWCCQPLGHDGPHDPMPSDNGWNHCKPIVTYAIRKE